VAPPPGRRNAGKPEPRPDDTDETPEAGSGEESAAADGRSAAADAFWAGVRVDPVEVALPGGVGYTLRAYRMDTEVTPTDIAARADEPEVPARAGGYADADLDDDFEPEDEDDDLDEDEDDEDTEDEDEGTGDDEDEADEDTAANAAVEPEEVPVFLSHGGRLLVFRSAEGLVDFVRSGAEHDLTQIDSWTEVAEGISAAHLVALPEDEYELDLVVNNLRGGHEVWDPELVVQAGQLARDLGHALHIETVVHALSPGAPLDKLDEVLRAMAEGGFGGFMARRKAKKIGAETASLGWRSVIGKISSVVDWRD
jgi:hypothetical protein